ncbi:MAG TPA: hypothetical protein VHF90_01275 [Thermoleophilaceae bacterium]|nr:hypothetical protein [Thermoleophilaceae bacterium]
MDRPDFQRWLEQVEVNHREAGRDVNLASGEQRCSGCGVELDDLDSPCGQCLVCLAEQYGIEQAEAAAYVGRVLAVALLSRSDTPPDIMRGAIEDVMDEYECLADARG